MQDSQSNTDGDLSKKTEDRVEGGSQQVKEFGFELNIQRVKDIEIPLFRLEQKV